MSHFAKTHFSNLEKLLIAQSNLCQSDLPNYDIGLNREFFVKEVLKTHLPTYCEITSGCVCDHKNKPSGQMDIILAHPLTFRINIGATDCCISESLFSVIEVKSRLAKKDFKAAVESIAYISGLSREHLGTSILGATSEPEAYYFNTIGSLIFAYKGYSSDTCIKHLKSLLDQEWKRRPEMIYSMDQGFVLIRDDYCRFHGERILPVEGDHWISKLSEKSLDGYFYISRNCLMVIVIMLSKRIQCNYHLIPFCYNYAM